MLKEFKEFAFKGNLVDMAVGFILGGAFATVVKSLVDNVIMPVVGLVTGGIDFTQMKYVLQAAELDADGVETVAEVAIKYGQTISDLVSFIILAFVVFILIKKLVKNKDEAPEEPPAQEVLLGEIRDALKK